MHRVTSFVLLTTVCAAQDGLGDHMQGLSEALTAIESRVGAAAGAIPADRIDAIVDIVAALGSGDWHLPDEADEWLAAIDRSAKQLREAGATSVTRRFDLTQLRGACTACHLNTRSDNDSRGLFPNHGNALFGTIDLLARDGTRRAARSGTVVFLEGSLGKSPPLPRNPTISQQGRRFHPPLLVVTAGTKVRFPNNDVVFHNVFSRSTSNPFDLGTYGKGIEREIVLENTGLVQVHCNIHPDMISSVLVLENAHATITRPNGFWAISDVPDGEYQLRVWHPLASVQPQRVQIAGGIAKPIAITIRESRSRIQHTNKHGRRYRSKY